MESQVANEAFREFIRTQFFKSDGSGLHDTQKGFCKCGLEHTPHEFMVRAVSEFKKNQILVGREL